MWRKLATIIVTTSWTPRTMVEGSYTGQMDFEASLSFCSSESMFLVRMLCTSISTPSTKSCPRLSWDAVSTRILTTWTHAESAYFPINAHLSSNMSETEIPDRDNSENVNQLSFFFCIWSSCSIRIPCTIG